jgi:hypothetical protein
MPSSRKVFVETGFLILYGGKKYRRGEFSNEFEMGWAAGFLLGFGFEIFINDTISVGLRGDLSVISETTAAYDYDINFSNLRMGLTVGFYPEERKI